jgi:hypothetical protein
MPRGHLFRHLQELPEPGCLQYDVTRHVSDHHTPALRTSFTDSFTHGETQVSGPDAAGASKASGKMSEKEIEQEKDAIQAGQAGQAAESTPPGGPPPGEAVPNKPEGATSGITLPENSQIDQRMKAFQKELNYILSEGKGNTKCMMARPVPQPNADLKATPIFNRPTLPICSRFTKGDCPFKVDHKSGKLVRKAAEAANGDENAEAGSDMAEPGEPPAGSDMQGAEMSMGGGAWPFNQTVLALMEPKPQPRCASGDRGAKRSLRPHRHAGNRSRPCGHSFL